ncbi:asialoglycoprotein receptor 2-like [Epargyreus clarus]|uniref:asialoglycoprotein receptor 2-like n=1 Tax=Epargyreus clarus TaxID=520877 RepID=UPI003C30772F
MEGYIIITLLIILSAYPCLSGKSYRSDYVFNRKTNAFYKLHTESTAYREAEAACRTEGAKLMVPSSPLDIAQAHGLFKQFPDLGDQFWIGDDGRQHESAEEQPIIDLDLENSGQIEQNPTWTCDLITRTGDVETSHCYRKLPFVCKVNANDAPYDPQCGVYANDYEYFENVGSCYKIPRAAYTWNQAYAECDSVGAHLLVINSEVESDVIKNITHSKPAVDGSKYAWFFLVGLRADKSVDGSPIIFKTIFGQSLKEAGFEKWSENEPNNSDGKEYCGSVFKTDGKYNDVDCTDLYGFICEKEVNKR